MHREKDDDRLNQNRLFKLQSSIIKVLSTTRLFDNTFDLKK